MQEDKFRRVRNLPRNPLDFEAAPLHSHVEGIFLWLRSVLHAGGSKRLHHFFYVHSDILLLPLGESCIESQRYRKLYREEMRRIGALRSLRQ